MDRLNNRDGVVCFVTNNSFVEQFAFDGMRKHMLQDFTRVYHLHLEGNVRQNPKLAGTAYNVFGIQVGVGITIAIRSAKHTDRKLLFHRVDKALRREAKCDLLASFGSLAGVPWQELTPDGRNTWLVPDHAAEFAGFIPVGKAAVKGSTKKPTGTIFKTYSVGVKTNRDDVVYDFDRAKLATRVTEFIDHYNAEVDRYKRAAGEEVVDQFVRYTNVKWSRDLKLDMVRGNYAAYSPDKIRTCLYRPYCKLELFFDRILNEEVYALPRYFPDAASEAENQVITVSDVAFRAPVFSALIARGVVDLHLCASVDAHQCFPFYVYAEDGTRVENVTDWALKQFRTHYKDKKLTKWDLFHYVYGLLHHPGYRTKFADNLKRDLPRVPFAPDFRAFAAAGKELAELHLNYEALDP